MAFTPFPPSSPPADSITSKGGLLSSDGADQLEVPVGTDGQILSADSSETSGLKWIPAPSGGGGPSYYLSSNISATATTAWVTAGTVTIPSSNGSSVELGMLATQGTSDSRIGAFNISNTGSGAMEIKILQNGSDVFNMVNYIAHNSTAEASIGMGIIRAVVATPPVGSVTYTLQFRAGFGAANLGTQTMQNVTFFAKQ